MNEQKRRTVGAGNGRHWLSLPVSPDVEGAIASFAAAIRARYPASDPVLYRFDQPDAPIDRGEDNLELAVVFGDEDWSEMDRVFELGELAFDVLLKFGTHLHGSPFSRSNWDSASSAEVARLKRFARRVS